MKKIFVALATSGCLFAAPPAMAQTLNVTLDIDADQFIMHGIAQCTMVGTVCEGNSFDGTGQDMAFGDPTPQDIAGFTLDFGTADIVFPIDQTDLSIWLNDGTADGRLYHVIHTLQFDFGDGQDDIPGWNLSTAGKATRQALVRISPAESPVPETASWAMMVFGFGLTGAAIRYRQRTSLSFT